MITSNHRNPSKFDRYKQPTAKNGNNVRCYEKQRWALQREDATESERADGLLWHVEQSLPKTIGGAWCMALQLKTFLADWIESLTTSWLKIETEQQDEKVNETAPIVSEQRMYVFRYRRHLQIEGARDACVDAKLTRSDYVGKLCSHNSRASIIINNNNHQT